MLQKQTLQEEETLTELGVRRQEDLDAAEEERWTTSPADQIAALARVSQVLNATLHLDDTLQAVLEEALQNTGAIGGQISLYSRPANKFQVRLHKGRVLPPGTLATYDTQAATEKSIILVPRLPHSESDRSDERQPEAALVMPITFQDSVAGLIHLFFPTAGYLTSSTQTFVVALANHAALAIGNASRFRELTERNTELQRRAQQIERVVESSRVFHSASPLTDVYEDLVYSIQEGVGFDVVLLSLARKHGEQWRLHRVSAAGLPLDRLRQLQQNSQPWEGVDRLMQPQYALGSAYFIPAHEATRYFNGLVGQMVDDLYPPVETSVNGDAGQWHPQDMFIIPLRNTAGDPLGLISLDAPHDGRRPDLNTARVLEIFANQAAAAIENVQLFHNTREYANQLRQLNELSQEVLSEPDVRRRLQRIADGFQAAGWQRVVLTLHDQHFNATELVAAGMNAAEVEQLRQRLPSAEQWEVRFTAPELQQFRQGSAYFVPQEEAATPAGEETVSNDQDAWQPGDRLHVPLFGRQRQPLAFITLDQPVNGRRPGESDLQLIDLYARFTAAVVETVRLVDQVLSRNEELNILFEASQAISGTLEPEFILEAMGIHLLQAAGATAFTIYRLQADQERLRVVLNYTQDAAVPAVEPKTMVALHDYPLAQKVMASHEPQALVLGETGHQQLPGYHSQLRPECSLVLFPINLRDGLFGLVELVGTGEALTLDTNQVRLLGAIINQGNTALETALLFADTLQRERFYAALGRVSLAINATLDLETVLNLICRESQAIFKANSVYIWQRQGDKLVGVAGRGIGAEELIGLELPLSSRAFSVSLAKSGLPAFVNRVQERQDIDLHLPQPESIQALMGIPLKKDDEVIGVLVFVDRRNPERFTSRDVDNASTFGVQTAIAIQNAQLVTELRELNEQLDEHVEQRTRQLAEESERVKILLRISTELTASLDKDRVLNRALHLVNEVINATQGNILLTDAGTDDLIFHAAFDTQRQSPPLGLRSSISAHEGLAGWVFQNRQAAIVYDTLTDERWLSRPGTSERHRSVLAVPLISGDNILGLMMLMHDKPNAFNENQLELVTAAGIQVANAVYNATLYDLIRDQAERLGTMMRDAQVEVAKTHSILESIGDGVLVATANGEIILVNPPTCKMLDVPRERLIGRPVYMLRGLYGPAGDAWLDKIESWGKQATVAGGQESHVEQITIGDMVVRVNVSPVFANREYIGTVSIFRDITEEVEVDRMKSEFVSTVSHELRTPMTSIKGYADLMLMGAAGRMNAAQDRYLRVIQKNADRLKLLVDDLLDISRIETGKTQLNPQPLDMTPIIHSVTNEHAPGRLQAMEKNINVTAHIAPALPLVMADPEKVTRILTNLVDNAMNYTFSGGEIEVVATAEGGFVFVSVRDTGIGISQDQLDKIFDRFYRSDDEVVQQVSGTGLGLAIVQSLVHMHGGEITVDSRPNCGSTFTFSLPVAEVVEDVD